MSIRRALAADAEAVGRIHVESWNVAYRGIMPDDVIARTDLASGFRDVTLWVLEENWNARRFYEKYGFHLDGGTRRYPKTQVPEVRYRIRLPNPY